jgi:hypothetical protein
MMYPGGMHIKFRDQTKDPMFMALNAVIEECHAKGVTLIGTEFSEEQKSAYAGQQAAKAGSSVAPPERSK